MADDLPEDVTCDTAKALVQSKKFWITLAGTIVTCPRHQSQFDLKDGKVVRWLKGSGFTSVIGKLMKQPTSLKTYEVKVENGTIFVKV